MRSTLAFLPIIAIALFRHQGNFFGWIRQILKQQKQSGQTICPLMIREPMRFQAPLVFCEIPKTRTIYMARTGICCSQGGSCRPAKTLGRMAQEETAPTKANRSKRPRGA